MPIETRSRRSKRLKQAENNIINGVSNERIYKYSLSIKKIKKRFTYVNILFVIVFFL